MSARSNWSHLKRILLIPLLITVAVPFSLFNSTQQVSAADLTGTTNPSSQTDLWYAFTAMEYCLRYSPIETNSGKVANGQLFYDTNLAEATASQVGPGFMSGDYPNSVATCGASNSRISTTALSDFGVSDILSFVCNTLGYTRNQNQACLKGKNEFNSFGGSSSDALAKAWHNKYKNKVTTGGTGDLPVDSSSIAYIYYKRIYVNACTTGQKYSDNTGGSTLKLDSLDKSDNPTTEFYVQSGTKQVNDTVDISIYTNYGDNASVLSNAVIGGKAPISLTCDQLHNKVNSDFATFSSAQKQYDAQTFCAAKPQSYTGASLDACVKGASNKGNTSYCADTYSSNVDQFAACGVGFGGVLVSSNVPPPVVDPASSCTIPTLGWILCPILTTGAHLADAAYKFISDSFLATDPSLVNTAPTKTTKDGTLIGTGTYSAWKIMLGIANVVFVIVFLIIIFSQLTGAAITNYGVKKMLPRLIVAAILVNLSFFICQIAVDLSNILGVSLKNIFQGVSDQVTAASGVKAAQTGDESGNLAGIVTIAIAAVVTGATFWTGITAVIIAIVGAIISLLTIFVILIVRKALIILLIVISPLAFVAFLLPNTEPIFQRWRKLLTTLLLLYPIIGLLYGASILASTILKEVAGTDMVMQIAAYIVLVVPLLAVFPLLKGALDGAGKIGGAVQSYGQKARGGAQRGAKTAVDRSRLGQFAKHRDGVATRRRAQIDGGTFTGSNKNPLNWGRNLRSTTNRKITNPLSGQFGSELAATGATLANEETERAVKSATALMTEQRLTSTELQSLASGDEVHRDGKLIMRKPNDAMRQAAVREKMRSGTTGEVESLLTGSAGASDSIRQEMARGIHSNGHVAKADYLGGDFADRIIRGEIGSAADLDDAAARRINTGKLSAETMVGQDADALERFARVSGEASAGSRTDISAARLDDVRDQAAAVLVNEQLRAKVSGQKSSAIDTMSRL